MHIHISKSETGDNKGSSRKLVAYLEKENRQLLAKRPGAEPEYWFNHENRHILPYQVSYDIDHNTGRLSKDEAKFFLVNISPSEHELHFLKEEFGEEGAKQQLKEYANLVMNEYARNFKKERVNGNQDLLYFGKVEKQRYYTHKDEEVKKGLAKRGEQKPGEQMHTQLIVSRKDITDSVRLSPLNNSRGSNKAHSLKVGQFNRVAFKEAAEQIFDHAFGYDRELWETFRYANTLKNGNYEQKQQIKGEERQIEKRLQHEQLEHERQQQKQQEAKKQHSQGLSP